MDGYWGYEEINKVLDSYVEKGQADTRNSILKTIKS